MREWPIHMVPTHILLVDRFPIASGGKVDRPAVLKLHGRPLIDEREFIEPQTETERWLSPIWAGELGLDKIGRDEDVFRDLAVDSLAALRLVLAMEAALGTEIGLSALFRAPTLRDFAAQLELSRDHRP
jgi:acyl carrier protein